MSKKIIYVMLTLFVVILFVDKKVLVSVWDYCYGRTVIVGEVVFDLPNGVFVFPSLEGSEYVVLGSRSEKDEFFPNGSDLSIEVTEESEKGFLEFVSGVEESCGSKCKEFSSGVCDNKNGVQFIYTVFDMYSKDLDAGYHAYYYIPHSSIMLQYHGYLKKFDDFKAVINEAKYINSRQDHATSGSCFSHN